MRRGLFHTMVEGIKANKRPLPAGKPDFRPRDEGGFRIKRQNVNTAIEDENTQGAEYILDGPLRRVTPYYYTYLTYCKLRWRDRLLYDIFCSEFRDKTPQQYKTAIENGKVFVNNKVADMTTVVRNGDLISHKTHKHERPVTSRPIKIVFEDEDLIVVDKPAGIPVSYFFFAHILYRLVLTRLTPQEGFGIILLPKFYYMSTGR